MIYCSSCSYHSRQLTDYFVQQQKVSLAKEECFPVDSIGAPIFIHTVKNTIIIVEPRKDYLLSAYNLSMKRYYNFLSKGRGPREMLDIQQISNTENENEFFVLDTHTKKVFTYSYRDSSLFIENELFVPKETVTFCCDTNLFIGTLSGSEHRFFLQRNNIDSICYFGDEINVRNLSNNLITQILSGFCHNSLKQKRIAWFSMYGDAFEIYDYTNPDNITLIHKTIGGLPNFTSEFIRGEKRPVLSGNTKLGITSLTGNDSYIFALYNGNLLKEASVLKDNIFYGDKILIYDWNGTPYKMLILNEKVKAINYCYENNALYAIGCDEISPKILYINCDTIL